MRFSTSRSSRARTGAMLTATENEGVPRPPISSIGGPLRPNTNLTKGPSGTITKRVAGYSHGELSPLSKDEHDEKYAPLRMEVHHHCAPPKPKEIRRAEIEEPLNSEPSE